MARFVSREASSGLEGVRGSRGGVERELGCDVAIVRESNWIDNDTED